MSRRIGGLPGDETADVVARCGWAAVVEGPRRQAKIIGTLHNGGDAAAPPARIRLSLDRAGARGGIRLDELTSPELAPGESWSFEVPVTLPDNPDRGLDTVRASVS